jgi:hypothetical protein
VAGHLHPSGRRRRSHLESDDLDRAGVGAQHVLGTQAPVREPGGVRAGQAFGDQERDAPGFAGAERLVGDQVGEAGRVDPLTHDPHVAVVLAGVQDAYEPGVVELGSAPGGAHDGA